MKLHQLIHNSTFNDIIEKIILLYPENINNIYFYENVFNNLKHKTPKHSNINIYIKKEICSFSNKKYFNVYGLKKGKPDQIHNRIPLEFEKWPVWLAMTISDETLHKFNYKDIIVHILMEITFISFSEEKIKNQKELSFEYHQIL